MVPFSSSVQLSQHLVIMSEIDPSLPTTKQELERKAIELLEQIEHDRIAHKLTPNDVALMCGVIWTLTAGLVGEEISQLTSLAAATHKRRPVTRHFAGNGHVLVLVIGATAGFVLQEINPTTTQRRVLKTSALDVGERELVIDALVAGLLKGGKYTEF